MNPDENLAAISWLIENWKLVAGIVGVAVSAALARNKLARLETVVENLQAENETIFQKFDKTAEALADLDKKTDLMKNDFGHAQSNTNNQLDSISTDVKTLTNQLIAGGPR